MGRGERKNKKEAESGDAAAKTNTSNDMTIPARKSLMIIALPSLLNTTTRYIAMHAKTKSQKGAFPGIREMPRNGSNSLPAFCNDKRQQGDRPCPFDGLGQCPLMFGTTAGNPAGHDLAALRDVIVKNVRTFIVYYNG